MSRKPTQKRRILVILSNRLNPSAPVRYLEVDSANDGRILGERPLRAMPREPRFDEVWENDEGRTEFSSCNRFKRKYRHRLERPRGV
jgi:hypothetical protein